MSHKLIDHSPDLKRLRDEGYEIQIKGSYLLIGSIPYVNSNREIVYGTIVSELTLAGEKAGLPKNHVVYFMGDQPCYSNGSEITALFHAKNKATLVEGIEIDRSFSNKPLGGYRDYYQKITTYVNIISGPAQSIDETVKAQTFKLVDSIEVDSYFEYPDTNSSRAEITAITDKLKNQKIGIVGTGGTGSYILDFVSKTPVGEIHLFDNDEFLVHNAFRAPGAPSRSALNETPKKVKYYQEIYSKMHRGIKAHDSMVTNDNIDQLDGMDYVFLSIDSGAEKKLIIQYLSEKKVTFIDSGMGIEVADNNSLLGILRVTTGIAGNIEHITSKSRISFAGGDDQNEYNQNIQIAELNALNAALAVIKWKKLCGFYHQSEKESHSLYSIDDNTIINEDFKT